MKTECSNLTATRVSMSLSKSLKFSIGHRFPSLNEVIAAAKVTGRGYVYSAMKKKNTNAVVESIPDVDFVFSTVFLAIRWFEKTRRRDPDNVAFGIKFILDGMCKKGIIKNDNYRTVAGWTNKFYYGESDKVEVNAYGTVY